MATTTVAITGNTYPVKEQLKSLGARWDGEAKAWMVAADKADAARAIVSRAPAQSKSTGTYRPSRCKSCGRTASQYNRIYRSGVCRECWRDEKEEAEMGW